MLAYYQVSWEMDVHIEKYVWVIRRLSGGSGNNKIGLIVFLE